VPQADSPSLSYRSFNFPRAAYKPPPSHLSTSARIPDIGVHMDDGMEGQRGAYSSIDPLV